ncbi:MAG TPA: DNA alkylation repair protein [Thermoanaerobaculia bacterium]|nr:DNA alkylation repair protein [Thermoanaerobaculia bacterium]
MTLADEIASRVSALSDRSAVPLRAIRCEFSKRLRGAAPRDVIALALELMPEHRFIAYELIFKHPGTAPLLNERMLKRLAGTLASWSDVDLFGVFLAGPAWREGAINDDVVARWARSHDRWWRRAALVSTIATADAKRTLAICRLLADDRDDLVVKAMSWALRALSKHDRRAVAEFVEKTPLAARVVREVRSKLTTGRKNP